MSMMVLSPLLWLCCETLQEALKLPSKAKDAPGSKGYGIHGLGLGGNFPTAGQKGRKAGTFVYREIIAEAPRLEATHL